jgi:hypothetical protein
MRKRLIKCMWALGACVLTVALYVLSVGPANWLCNRGLLPEAFLEIVYRPLEGMGTGKNSMYRRYLDFWNSPPPNAYE